MSFVDGVADRLAGPPGMLARAGLADDLDAIVAGPDPVETVERAHALCARSVPAAERR